MHTFRLRHAVLTALVLGALVAPARADVLQVVSTDAHGLTVRVTTEAWSLAAPGADGRRKVIGVPDAHSLTDPGHALLPAYSALLLLPPDARPSVRVLSASAPVESTGVRLAIAGKPSFVPGPHQTFEPAMDDVAPVLDGAWPREPVSLGAMGAWRGRRYASLEVRPFQYDEAGATLRATASMLVRVEFNRPAGAAALPARATAPDPNADDVMRAAAINWDQGASWRLAPAADPAVARVSRGASIASTRALGFDETQPEVRVKLDSAGVWLLPFDQLAANGFPAGVPVAQVSVHRHEFLENSAVQPYATQEIPVEVEDANGNNVFDSGDRVWVYTRTWAQRSGASEYQRTWGDAEVVYATVRTAGGLRMATRPGWRGQVGLTPPASYPASEHWERNYASPMGFIDAATDTSQDLFPWTEITYYYDRQDTIQFTVNDIDTSHAVQMAVRWQGRTYGPHNQSAAIKNRNNVLTTAVDSLYWTDKQPRVGTGSVRGSAFSEGLNRFVTWGRGGNAYFGGPSPTGNFLDNAGLNWFETTYWRRYKAVHDVLACSSADATGEIQLHCTGMLADSLRVFDVTDPENPVRLLIDEAHVTRSAPISFDFQDSVATGAPHLYIVTGAQDPIAPSYGPRVPADDHFAAVTRLHLQDHVAGDYVIIVPEAFQSAMAPLVAMRQATGLRVVLATAEDVYDEFNGGRHSAAAIQRFVRYAYRRWNMRFLLLGGDGTMDPQQLVKDGSAFPQPYSGVDWIPVNPVAGPVTVSLGYEVTVSDNLYGMLTGNNDPILSSGPVIPEIMIGRLPANSLADMTAMVSKIVKFEDHTTDPAWRRNVLLVADDAYSGDSFFGGGGGGASGYCFKDYEQRFVRLSDKCRSVILNEAGLRRMNVISFNERYYLPNEAVTIGAFGDTCRNDRALTSTHTHAVATKAMFDDLNAGTLWWNYQGHANEGVLAHEGLYVNSGENPGADDKWQFGNTDQTGIWSAFSCHANMFARWNGKPTGATGGCIGEDLVTFPQRGCVASWASVCYEVVPADDSTHINVEFARSMFRDPPRDNQLWDHGSRVVLGEVIQATYLRYMTAVESRFSFFERGLATTYTLLGDPGLRVSIGLPQSTVWANDSATTDGQFVRLHTAGDTLTLVADLASTARLDSLGLWQVDGNLAPVGVAASQYSLSPTFPDTAGGGISGGRRFRLTYGTHLPASTRSYVFRVTDRDGLKTTYTVGFALDATLRVDGVAIHDGDDVSPTANLSLMLVSPAPLDPQTEITMTVNGVAQAFTAVAAPGDASGREWILSWTHPAYAKDDYVVETVVRGAANLTRRFKVSTATGDLRISNLFAFPNPFDNDGTTFTYQLLGSDPADVRVTVMTITGRRIWSQDLKGLAPGYHQLPWNGSDAEGDELANGVYFYRLSATSTSGRHADQLGRLVKLRKPRHVDVAATP